jgi:hypothetical protein
MDLLIYIFQYNMDMWRTHWIRSSVSKAKRFHLIPAVNKIYHNVFALVKFESMHIDGSAEVDISRCKSIK